MTDVLFSLSMDGCQLAMAGHVTALLPRENTPGALTVGAVQTLCQGTEGRGDPMQRGPDVKHTDGKAVPSTDNQGGDWQADQIFCTTL